MIDLVHSLPSGTALFAFMGASLILAITPGPGVLFIVMRSVAQGRAVGLASVAGVALGNFGNALAAAVGLAALFAVSSVAFTVVKWAGAAYLIYLGVQQLREAAKAPIPAAQKDAFSSNFSPKRNEKLGTVFRDGALVALFNPKTTIFFAAFLPQFMRADVSAVGQGIALGALFVLIAAVTDSVYALLASAIAPRVQRGVERARAGKIALGATFIGLGVMTAFAQRPKG
jgi:threonine/homoserine/homoserine lactone efflux protein